ncbi:MAG: hypothetical protein N2321_07345 [Melioribacteraceae bacterium]|nr:hypothetical protein [Melioribacteraceae bacterium]
MKKQFILFLILSSVMFGQFREELNKPVDIKSGVYNKSFGSLLGLFGVENFQMHHSFGLSFSSFGFGSMAIGSYTNTMNLKFSDKLNLIAELSVLNSPYNSFGKDFSKQINGIYIDRLQMNYKISDGMSVMLQYSNSPFNYYSPYYYGSSPFFRSRFFNNSFFENE